MEKRIIIAAVFSVLIILGWGYLMPLVNKPVPPAGKASVSAKTSSRSSQSAATNSNGHPGVNAINGVINKGKSPEKTPVVNQTSKVGVSAKSSDSSQDVIAVARILKSKNKVQLKGGNINAEFSLPEGSLAHLILHTYSYSTKNGSGKVDLANSVAMKKMVDFVLSNDTPLAVKLISVLKGKNFVGFVYNLGGKFILTKKYIFSDRKYSLDETVSVKNISLKPILFKGNFVFSSHVPTSKKKVDNSNHINLVPIIYLNKKTITPQTGQNTRYDGDISFAGFNSKYFLFSAISPGKSITLKYNGTNAIFEVPRKAMVAPGATKSFSLKFYGGPKKLSLLKPLGHSVSSTLNFGFFGFFSIILLRVLQFFYGYVHNYGIAIMLLVFGIRLVFYPLTYTGFKSMKQMQKLTPKINELREKYKDDKSSLNKKIMELYKESKVNPFGGCLPMILQIPVFYGLYQALLISIQLRNAPFAFWIHNLSAQDPYYVLPILMGISMFVSQKMNPSIGDPTQAKIMLILPVVFTFIFVHFPAGLLLYWTINNILTIVQQYIINRKFA